MTKIIFCRCGIITLSIDKVKEIEKICKIPMLKKLYLSEKFLHRIIYTEKSILGLKLMRPNNIIAMLANKLYLSNIRRHINV